MRKKVLALSLALTLTLSLTPALAAGTADKFPAKNTWAGFSDVASDHWAAGPIKVCYETGIMNGKKSGFDPNGGVTMAEAVVVAARVGATARGGTIPASTDGTWYGGELSYLKALPGGDKINALGDLGQKTVSRYGFFLYLSVAVPENALAVKNSITTLPDTDDQDVLRFYNAGVLTGVNAYGTFAEGKGLSRAEMAAMVSRIARPETALAFTPKTKDDPDFDPIAYYTGVSGKTPAITGRDVSVTMLDYLAYYVGAANELVLLCDEQGIPFSWDLAFEDGTTLPDDAMDTATSTCLQNLWKAKYGGGQYDAATALGAKHILVDTKAEADAIRAQLKAAGDTSAKFDELMEQLKGTAKEAAAYTFGPGDMVAEFENGTKALNVGEISQPVQSQFGWHIILRTEPDPAQLTEVTYSDWFDAQGLQYSDALLTVDLTGFYDHYTADQ